MTGHAGISSARMHIDRGKTLFQPGQECPGFVVVHRGIIKVSLTAENGREIILYRVRPGEICLQTFGCLMNARPYSAEGMAESELEIEIVPSTEFQRRVIDDDGFRQQLFVAVASRFDDMERLVEDVALTGFEGRLARALLRLQDEAGIIAATHEAIAVEIGSGRAAVTRGLGALAHNGLIEIARGRIQIIAPDQLHMLARDAS